jgi:hypothetical protein
MDCALQKIITRLYDFYLLYLLEKLSYLILTKMRYTHADPYD